MITLGKLMFGMDVFDEIKSPEIIYISGDFEAINIRHELMYSYFSV